MKKILFLQLLWLIQFHGQSQTLIRSEFLGKPSNNSVTVNLQFSEAVDAKVEFGTVSGSYTGQTTWQPFAQNQPVEITIFGLQSNTKYYYRVNYRSQGSTNQLNRPEFSFRTQRTPSDEFTFVIQADPHLDELSDTLIYQICLQNQLDDHPDFMIDLGDFIMTDKLKNSVGVIPHDTIVYRCNLLRSYYERISHSVPIYNVLGNHEGEAGWNLNNSPDNIAVWNTQERQKYFLNPSPDTFYSGDTVNHPYVGKRENYFSWTWGNALFVVIDPYWYTMTKPDSLNGWRWTLGKTQYDWLRNVLENSQSQFKFVFAHQLVGGDPDGRGGVEFADKYEWGGQNLDGSYGFDVKRPGWYKPIKDLLTENKVNIFFHGHDHFYGQQVKDCMIYQETPQPSHPNFNSTAYATSYGYVEGNILPNSGHLRAHVTPTGVTIEYVRTYKPQNENNNRHNKDVSATYFIGVENCYDSLSTGIPVLWNASYPEDIVYPNPFSKETTIRFSNEITQNLYVFIFDSKGVEVRKLLVNNLVQQGDYQIVWDGKSSNGSELTSGNYQYRITGSKGLISSGNIQFNR